jgi:hypothetical protein
MALDDGIVSLSITIVWVLAAPGTRWVTTDLIVAITLGRRYVQIQIDIPSSLSFMKQSVKSEGKIQTVGSTHH